jgi:hypothetical protein
VKDDAALVRDDLLSEAFCREQGELPRFRAVGRPMLRRLGLRALIALALLAGVDLLARALWSPEDLLPWTLPEEAAYTVKVARFTQAPAPDVLFLGSSRVKQGLIPEVFAADLEQRWGHAARAFNLGLNNARAEEYLSIVRSHLPDPPPARLVLGITGSEVVRPEGFQYASRFLWTLPDAVDWWQRSPAEARDARELERFAEREVSRLWYVYGHRDALREAGLELLRERSGWSPLDEQQRQYREHAASSVRAQVLAEDGYGPPAEASGESLEWRLRQDPGSIHVPGRELDATPALMKAPPLLELRQLAALLAGRGCRLALVETPVSPWLQQRNPVLHGEVFRERMSELAAELGIVWIPMPASATHLNNAAYEDASHLSQAGARRYTRLLFAELAAAGFFEDAAP